jgi:hypothetical protein
MKNNVGFTKQEFYDISVKMSDGLNKFAIQS